jgi:hypothetical protein
MTFPEKRATLDYKIADQELADLMNSYSGPLPRAQAWSVFHHDGANFRRSCAASPTQNTYEVLYPPQLAKETGEAGWAVPAGRLLHLLAEDCYSIDPGRATKLHAAADRYYPAWASEISFSPVVDKRHILFLAGLKEVVAILAAPELTGGFHQARSFINYIKRTVESELDGTLYAHTLELLHPPGAEWAFPSATPCAS